MTMEFNSVADWRWFVTQRLQVTRLMQFARQGGLRVVHLLELAALVGALENEAQRLQAGTSAWTPAELAELVKLTADEVRRRAEGA
ncbi:MAG: hypothetical protein Kow00106_12290 [Anaerolineae bacterium]